jgi:hypothetical protein
MKIAFYCESPADQAAMRVFAEGILGEPPEPINMDLETRGVPQFFRALDGAFRGVHFNSDAEALVVVVDSDDTELHEPSHEKADGASDSCRFCQVRKVIAHARGRLRPRQYGPELKVAIGLAVPTIEAWYLVGRDHEVGEPAWKVGLQEGRTPFSRPELKKLVYGTDRPSLETETDCATREARRVIGNIAAIEIAFPNGFGLMAREMRSWVGR